MNEDDYEVKNEVIQAMIKKMSEYINSKIPKGWGFCLLVFDYKDNGSMFYMSNAERESMIEGMEEFIAKQKSKL